MPRKKTRIFTLDCETDPFKVGRVPLPFIWGLYDGETYEEFATGFDVARRLEKEKAIVYAHNGGKFDYHYLRDEINCNDEIMVIAGRIAQFWIGECEFRDSINILPVALKQFQKEEINYELMERDRRDEPNIRAEISKYLRSDCVNLHDFIMRYFKEYGRGLTQAGAAMRYWSRLSGIKPPRQSAVQFERYRPFYYGGRVQCFEAGHAVNDFSVVDINSAYPYAMQFKHPFAVNATVENHLPSEGSLHECFVRLDAIARGCFPWRDESGSLYFPDDETTVREYFVTGWELKTALELDAVKIIRIIDVHRFPEVIDFETYIEHFYTKRMDARLNGDKAGDIFAKLLMNSLYGKFSSDPSKYAQWVISDDAHFNEWIGEGFAYSKPWSAGRHLMSRPYPEEKHRYYNIATAASITGFVRAFLFESLSRCSGPLYCDTDSIAARDVSRLEQGAQLGRWKVELHGKEYAIAGKKLYAFRGREPGAQVDKWKTASKGVKLSPAEIIRASRGERVTYEPDIPTYTIHARAPEFRNRIVTRTARDIRKPDDYRKIPVAQKIGRD